MLKIKQIDFQKTTYDDSLSHHIFSTANIYFSNSSPIIGALLFWSENKDSSMFTAEKEYKFFYDMAETKYFASVKFPKDCTLTRDQRQELAYILLEQRGCIGTYSFQTNKDAATMFEMKRIYSQLQFPMEFQPEHFSHLFNMPSSIEITEIMEQHPYYTRPFITGYLRWMTFVCQAHPSHFETYLDQIAWKQLCYQNPYLTERFLIQHLDQVDWHMLQFNLPVLNRLSKSLKQYLIQQLDQTDSMSHDIVWHPLKFIENAMPYPDDYMEYLPEDEEDQLIFGPFAFFEYDRGKYIWPGSEHMVTGIPSFARQLYTVHGEKRFTNKEMDLIFTAFSPEQRYLFETSCELHWLHRYKNEVNWENVCALNPHLSEDFIEKHKRFVNWDALGINTQITVSTQFIEKNLFSLSKPVVKPLVLKYLTEDMYTKYEQHLPLHAIQLKEYEQILTVHQLELIERLREQ